VAEMLLLLRAPLPPSLVPANSVASPSSAMSSLVGQIGLLEVEQLPFAVACTSQGYYRV
jgi:hypothetical protein